MALTREDARRDLFLNQKSPLLFRKYMLEYWQNTTKAWEQSWNPLSEDQKYRILIECGVEVSYIVHECGMAGFGEGPYDPHKEWTWEMVKQQFGGPCSRWSGHIGYCWDGTYCDGRTCAHTGGGELPPFDRQPYKINYTLPESWS